MINMTHNEWLYKIKRNFDRYDLGYTKHHWTWLRDEYEYKLLISKNDVRLFYTLAVRN